jgi:hypothetical protein
MFSIIVIANVARASACRVETHLDALGTDTTPRTSVETSLDAAGASARATKAKGYSYFTQIGELHPNWPFFCSARM